MRTFEAGRADRAAGGAFVGFFLGAGGIVGLIALFHADLATYSNGGTILLVSVGVGAAVGAVLGAAIGPVRLRDLGVGWIVALLAGAVAGCLVGPASWTDWPLAGAIVGIAAGAIAGGLLGIGLSYPPSPIDVPSPIAWEDDLDFEFRAPYS